MMYRVVFIEDIAQLSIENVVGVVRGKSFAAFE